MGFDKIFDVLANVTGWLTPKERIRRLKDEKDKLEKERSEIIIRKAEEQSARRLGHIDDRLAIIGKLLENTT